MSKVVYTSLDGFKLKRREVKSYTSLKEEFVDWINENTIKLLEQRNEAELAAGVELNSLAQEFYGQVFFMINGRSYFLDYYLPKSKTAIEIDGGYHKERRIEDRVRDMDFNEIGIRTIRIRSKDVLDGKFLTILKSRLKRKKKSIINKRMKW